MPIIKYLNWCSTHIAMQVIGAAGTHGPPAVSPVQVDSVPGQEYVRDVVRTAVYVQLENSSRLTSATDSPVMVKWCLESRHRSRVLVSFDVHVLKVYSHLEAS